jgi:hypothetical protein
LADHPSALDCHEGITYYTANHDSAVATAQRFMNAPDLVALVHLAGFATGIPLFAAVLGLIWNAGTVATFGRHDFGLGQLSPWCTALAYTALGFLPAVGTATPSRRSSRHWARRRRSATASMTTSTSSRFRGPGLRT